MPRHNQAREITRCSHCKTFFAGSILPVWAVSPPCWAGARTTNPEPVPSTMRNTDNSRSPIRHWTSVSLLLVRIGLPHGVDELLNLVLLFIGRIRLALTQPLENRKLFLCTGVVAGPG